MIDPHTARLGGSETLSEADAQLARGLAPVARDLALTAARAVLAEALREAVDGSDSDVADLLRQLIAEVVRPPELQAAAWQTHLAHVTERPSVTTDLRPGAA